MIITVEVITSLQHKEEHLCLCLRLKLGSVTRAGDDEKTLQPAINHTVW